MTDYVRLRLTDQSTSLCTFNKASDHQKVQKAACRIPRRRGGNEKSIWRRSGSIDDLGMDYIVSATRLVYSGVTTLLLRRKGVSLPLEGAGRAPGELVSLDELDLNEVELVVLGDSPLARVDHAFPDHHLVLDEPRALVPIRSLVLVLRRFLLVLLGASEGGVVGHLEELVSADRHLLVGMNVSVDKRFSLARECHRLLLVLRAPVGIFTGRVQGTMR